MQPELTHRITLCAQTGLRKMLQNTIGANRMSTITVLKLIGEIVKAAVENQSDLLKKVKLIEASRNVTSR